MTSLPDGEPVRPLVVPTRFRGPARSGNGGWSAGALAERLAERLGFAHDAGWPPVQVRLTSPPPLDQEVDVVADEVGVTCAFGAARRVDQAPAAVAPVPAAAARAAESSYAGLSDHPFPSCFACGTDREADDGLRLFPGRIDDDRVAATWTPHPSTAEDWHLYADGTPRASLPITWAATDCVGGWAGEIGTRPMVLGQMTGQVHALPGIGEEHVVVGRRLGREGRRTHTAATLYDAAGRVVARAEHVWVAVDPAAFNRL